MDVPPAGAGPGPAPGPYPGWQPGPAPYPPPYPWPWPQRASFGQRLGGAVIDGIVLLVPMLTLMGAGFGGVFAIAGVFGAESPSGSPPPAFVPLLLLALGGMYALFFFGSWLYHGVLVARSGQTPGKRVMGIKVVDAATGGPVTLGRATLRWVVQTLASGQLFGLGYLWMLWDDQGRTWHDMAARTAVVVVPRSG